MMPLSLVDQSSCCPSCVQLHEQINILTSRIDDLSNLLFRELSDKCTQTITSQVTASTQTDTCNDNVSVALAESQTDEYLDNILFNVYSAAQHKISVDADGDTSFFPAAQLENTGYADHHDNIIIKNPDILPFMLHPDQPFKAFSLTDLDTSIKYSHTLVNRCIAYYGEHQYQYGDIVHPPNPITGNTYLAGICDQFRALFPELLFNSVLITKYRNGSDSLGYHSDNEPEISLDSFIATISLGENRLAKFRANSDGTDWSINLQHGDLFLMSRRSQDLYQHSIPQDYSKNPRISITLRHIIPDPPISTQEIIETLEGLSSIISQPDPLNGRGSLAAQPCLSDGYQAPCVEGYQGPSPTPPHQHQQSTISSTTHMSTKQHISTVYISSSMFRELDSFKLSSNTQSAAVIFYPGATAEQMLQRIQTDDSFKNINPEYVNRIFLLCGTNNVDRILRVPRHLQREILGPEFTQDNHQFAKTTEDIAKLTHFLHHWACSATISVINILPRATRARNQVINDLNLFIDDLCQRHTYLNTINTEVDRNLYSDAKGYRKHMYFNSNGLDNVHLNNLGIIRLGKHLKYLVHH